MIARWSGWSKQWIVRDQGDECTTPQDLKDLKRHRIHSTVEKLSSVVVLASVCLEHSNWVKPAVAWPTDSLMKRLTLSGSAISHSNDLNQCGEICPIPKHLRLVPGLCKLGMYPGSRAAWMPLQCVYTTPRFKKENIH